MIPFENVARKIETMIVAGQYTSTLPCINELCEIHQVGPSTVKRALNLLKQMEYIRGFQGKCILVNPAACNNPYFRKNVVVCVNMELLGNQFYAFVLNDLNHHLAELNCRMSFVNSIRRLREYRSDLDAAILIEIAGSAELEEAADICGRERLLLLGSHVPGYLFVDSDNTTAGVRAMEYLHGELGHRKIGVLGIELELELSFDRQRLAGARKYAATHPDLQLYPYETSRTEDPRQCAERLLTAHPDITAVFAVRDYLALGCYSYCQSKHIRIPQDFSILGFDGRDFGQVLYPPLSTFQQDTEQIAGATMQRILAILHHGATPLPSCTTDPIMIRRESCGRVRSAERTMLHCFETTTSRP